MDNILNHKKPINLYNRNQFHNNYKIDEHILKKPYPKKKKNSPYWSYQKKYDLFTTINLKPPT